MRMIFNLKKALVFLVLLLSFTGFMSNQSAKAAELPSEIQNVTVANELNSVGSIGPMVNDPGGGAYTMQVGDIFTTSDTASSEILGHSAIAVSSTEILHISGPGQSAQKLTLATWLSRYNDDTTWVHRVPNLTYTQKVAVAKYAVSKYWNAWGDITSPKSIYQTYFITSNTASFDPTYCSKIVWQAYYYGTGSLPVMKSIYVGAIIRPYAIRDGGVFNSTYLPYQVGIFY
jgi:uncharacterized protein YycO